jgi:hypothetical protein
MSYQGVTVIAPSQMLLTNDFKESNKMKSSFRNIFFHTFAGYGAYSFLYLLLDEKTLAGDRINSVRMFVTFLLIGVLSEIIVKYKHLQARRKNETFE